MSDENTAENVEPIKKVDGIHTTGSQRSLLLQLCDGMRPKEKGKARIYQRVFLWATQGEWEDYDDWGINEETKLKEIPSDLKDATEIIDADKKQKKAIVVIIPDAMTEGLLPGAALRKLDKVYAQIEGVSIYED